MSNTRFNIESAQLREEESSQTRSSPGPLEPKPRWLDGGQVSRRSPVVEGHSPLAGRKDEYKGSNGFSEDMHAFRENRADVGIDENEDRKRFEKRASSRRRPHGVFHVGMDGDKARRRFEK